jgi:EmrB/QacA subfamily drug resistance transporter
MALVVVAGGMMLSVINVSIVNIALPAMAEDFDVPPATIGWVVTGYLVTQATLLPIAGRAGDVFGRRRVFVLGVLVLSGASLLAAAAPNEPLLIVFRILQGVGGSAMAPTAFAFAAELFEPRERGQALGVMGGVLGLAPVLSLNIAGVLVEETGWRSVFLFSPIVGLVVLAGAALILPEAHRDGPRRSFDIPGAALAASGLFSILLALSKGNDWGWSAPATLAALAGGVALLAAFAWRETVAHDPMIDLSLFRLRSLATANLAAMASAGALFGVLLVLPFALSAALGFGPIELGLAITPIAASFVVVAPIAGRLMARTGAARMASAGFTVAALGAVGMGLAATARDYTLLLPGLVAFGVGLAMSTSPITTTAISEVPRARLGVASSLPNISRYVGGGLGSAILVALVGTTTASGADRAGDLVAADFRVALFTAAGMLLVAAAIAARMPTVTHAAEHVVAAPPAGGRA